MLRGTLYVLALVLAIAIFAKVRSRRARQAALLIISYALYVSWGPWFALVLLGSTAMNFLLGAWVRRKHSALVLWAAILLNLALLGSFKYLPEAAVALPFSSLQRFSHLALPLGISFWTFQAMSYLFDLYRGEALDPSFWEFALYMAFFPVAISGPICRLPQMLAQFRSENALAWDGIGHGFRRIATGALMMLLARLLGQGILAGDSIITGFDHATHWTGADAWCLAFGYGLQLFFDFAGYSHIAIGAAGMLGFALPENFARPFHSTSPAIFWTRWHMSLSFWIRDYVFLWLIVLRRDGWWRNLVLIISMVLFGLWHKASLLFLLWGCYHGVLLVLYYQWDALQRRFDWTPPAILWTPLSWITTMALMSLGWIFFRASSVSQAGQMLAAIVSPASYASRFLSLSLYLLVAALAAGYAVVALVSEMLTRHAEGAEALPRSGVVAQLARNRWYWVPPLYVLAMLLVLMVTLTQGGNAAQFMYRGF